MSAVRGAAAGLLDTREVRALLALAAALVVAGVLLHASGIDAAWILQVHAHAPPLPSIVGWSCVTVIGLGWSALIMVLAADRDGAVAALLVPTFLIGSVLTHVPKTLMAVPRPAATDLLPHLHVIGDAFRGPVSMPSGHALTATASATLLWLAWRGSSRGGSLAVVLGFAAAIVGASRVAVGAHWPSDVFVGAGLGLAAVALAHALAVGARTRRLHGHLVQRVRSRAGQAWVALAEIAAAAGLLAEHTGYPEGRYMVLALAAVAAMSAAWRGYLAILPRARSLPESVEVPAGPT